MFNAKVNELDTKLKTLVKNICASVYYPIVYEVGFTVELGVKELLGVNEKFKSAKLITRGLSLLYIGVCK